MLFLCVCDKRYFSGCDKCYISGCGKVYRGSGDQFAADFTQAEPYAHRLIMMYVLKFAASFVWHQKQQSIALRQHLQAAEVGQEEEAQQQVRNTQRHSQVDVEDENVARLRERLEALEARVIHQDSVIGEQNRTLLVRSHANTSLIQQHL